MKVSESLQKWEAEIKSAKQDGARSYLRIGRALSEINRGNLWASVADSFVQYVDMAHGFKKSWAYDLINVWETWGVLNTPELEQTDVTRLVKLLPVTTEENSEDLLHMAATVPSQRDFEYNLRNLKGKLAPDEEHEHSFHPIGIEQCEVCGLKRRVKE